MNVLNPAISETVDFSITGREIDETLAGRAGVPLYTQPPELCVCHAMAARRERRMECEVTREWQD